MRRWGKRAMAAALAVSLIGGSASAGPTAFAAGAANTGMQIMLDGFPLPFDSAPKAVQGVTLVPFRAIAEALGITVVWDPAAKEIRASGDNGSGQPTKVVLRIGRKTAEADGASVPLLAAPVIQQSRVLIPLAFFARQFGAQVGWNAATHTVEIQSPKRAMNVMGFYAISSYDQIGRVASLNSVAFGWTQIDENGSVTLTGSPFFWPEAAGEVTPESIVQAVNDQQDETYLMVYSGDAKRQLTKLLTDASLRDQSIERLVSLAQENGFTGLMLDFEGLGWKDDPATAKKQLNDYVELLSKKAKPLGIKLALALQPPNGAYKGYDYGTLAKLADKIVLMAYNYHQDKTPEPIDRVNEAIQMALKAGVSAEQLLLAVNMDHENETSVGSKLGLAKRYGLDGVAFWRLGILTAAETQAIDASVVKE